jgi:hypothetical protein
LEFDIPRFWPGRRLHDLFTGDMTWRELRTFMRNAPRESLFAQAVHGDAADWGTTDYLITQLINDARQIAAGKELPPHRLIQPPGTKPAARKVGGAKELDELFTGGG